MTDHFFLMIMQLKLFGFYMSFYYHAITSNNYSNVVSPIYTVFVILCWYSKKWDPRSFPGTIKIKQLSPDILKFSTKHENSPFTLNYSMVPHSLYLYFMQGCVDWVLIIFGTQVIKKKRSVWLVFPNYLSIFYGHDFMQHNIKMQHVLGWSIKGCGSFLKYAVQVSKTVAYIFNK